MAAMEGAQEDFPWAPTSQEGSRVRGRNMNKLHQTHIQNRTKTQQENKTSYINCKKKKEFWFYLFFNIVNIVILSSRHRKKNQEHCNKRNRSPPALYLSCNSFVPCPHPKQVSCAVPWTGMSLSSKHVVLDPRQPIWLWLASLAGISSPEGAGLTSWPLTLFTVRVMGPGQAALRQQK